MKFIATVFLILFLAGSAFALPTPQTAAETRIWTSPATNTDGTPLTDLKGFKIYWKLPAATNYSDIDSRDLGLINSILVSTLGLQNGVIYCFVVTAYNSAGYESLFSNEVCGVDTIPLLLPTAPVMQ